MQMPPVKFEVTTSEVVRIADITATDFVVTPTGADVAVAPIGGNGTLANKFEVTVSGYDAGTFRAIFLWLLQAVQERLLTRLEMHKQLIRV